MSSVPSGAGYDNLRARWTFLHDSYYGGARYRLPSLTTMSNATAWRVSIAENGTVVRSPIRYQTYLLPHSAEDDTSFSIRLALAAYINLPGPIVDAYSESVTGRVERTFPEQWGDMADVDGRGSSAGEHIEEAARWMATYGMIAAVVDTPTAVAVGARAEDDVDAQKAIAMLPATPDATGKAPLVPASRGDEIAAGIKPCVIVVHPTSFAWLDTDDYGRLTEFSYVEQAYQPDQTAGALRGYQRVRVRVWTTKGEPVEGRPEYAQLPPARWEIREGMVSTALGTGLSTQRMAFGELIAAGPLPDVLQGKLPVEFGYYKRVSSSKYPLGQSLIDDAADIARSIYNKLSWEDEIHRKAGFPFLALPSATTGGQLDPETKREIGPDKALPYDSDKGAPQWIQPSSESSKELRDSCVFRFMLALRTAGLEVAADQSAQVQSGMALRIRSRDFESRAQRFANNVEGYERRVWKLYALLGGLTGEPTIAYPKRFTLPDPSEDLINALMLLDPAKMPLELGIPGKLAVIKKALDAVLSLSDAEMKAIMDNIEELMEQDAKLIAASNEARMEALKKGPPGDDDSQAAPNDAPPATDDGAAEPGDGATASDKREGVDLGPRDTYDSAAGA